ncbi:PilZ domain-containing protein [Oryzomonas sagensis]|uniref:PilZ domain-containing protein n=1 Tax=Oryzomonas sagensis TaxID=2603857 RepID=UPI0017843F42|nr:PilZ domain-containing protein [Oryzomonas sagensis]
MENRNFTRVDFSGVAAIRHDDCVISGTVKNLSLQGFNSETSGPLPLNTPLKVAIRLSSNTFIYLNTQAIYFLGLYFGMKICKIDVGSFVLLRDIILSKCHDQMLLMHETYKMAHCIH